MKLFISVFFVIFGVFGLSACSGKKSDETNSVNPRAPGEKPGKPGEKPGGSRELTVSDKFFIRAVHGQRISHEIFSELWMHIWENRMSRPNSIFLDLMQFIETHRDPKANHYILKNNQCPERQTQMVVRYKDQAKTAVSNVSFQVADCSRNPQWQELAYATVLDRADSNGGAVKSTIQWDIFNQFFPRGAGKHLSTEKMRSKCIMEHLDEKRLARLQCEFVGQSHDSESHLLFSRLNFDRGSNQLVIAEGKKFKNGLEACEDAKFCTVIRVPNEGTIEIIETLGSGKPERVGISAPQALTPISAGLDPLDQNALGEVIKPAEDPAEKVDPQAQNL